MLDPDGDLVRWVRLGTRSKVTLGQIATLVELSDSVSVAAMSGGDKGSAVGFRQQIARLEGALSVGALTQRTGNVTKVTELGQVVAGEARQFLQSVREVESESSRSQTWLVGAGDAWLQSVVVPALARTLESGRDWRWQVTNVKSADLIRGLREGIMHFGFLRAADIRPDDRLHIIRKYAGGGYSVLAGGALGGPSVAHELIRWLRNNRHPLIQQGTTWKPLTNQLALVPKYRQALRGAEPAVICDTYSQAAAAAVQSSSWCIVPSKVAEFFAAPLSRVARLEDKRGNDMALVTHVRRMNRVPEFAEAIDALRSAIAAVVARGIER